VHELPGTEGGFHPAFSPDGEWVVFSVENELRKVPTRGGPVVSVARTGEPPLLFPHWGPEGVIALSKSDGLYRVPAVGGTPELVLEVPGPFAARLPFILPDGGGWLFTLVEGGLGGSEPDLMLLDPGTGEASLLAEGGSGGVWLPTGHVAFTHASGSLFAGRFDLAAGRFESPPAPVLDSVIPGLFGRSFAASGSGGAVYLSGGAGAAGGALAQVVFMSPTGGDPQVPPIDRTDHMDGRFSPDGRRLAYTFDGHIWVYDLELGSKPRFTTEGSNHHDPVWSPDGTRIAFGSERDTLGVDVWVQEVDGDSPARLVFQLPGPQYPREWTAEGLVVQTSHGGPAGNTDIYIVPVDGDGGPRPYLRADWDESLARVSPDGRWLAYQSGDTEPPSIVVRAFPEPGRAYRITRPEDGFASNPVWSPEGSTIYYTHPATRRAMAAEVRTDPDFEVVSRREIGTVTGELKDVHPDGDYLLTFQFGDLGASGSPARLIIVGNWLSELVSRLGERSVR
jgi:serine/threonine-protein kinase